MKGKEARMKLALGFAILIILSLSFVSAQYGFSYNVDRGFSWIENNVGPFFGYVLGGTNLMMFERILLFFILLSLIYVILARMNLFKGNLAVIWIVTLAVSLLATRYMSDLSLVKNVLLPYTIFGVSLTAAVPMIIYFFFVQSFDSSSTLRKVLWVFFIVVFLGIWADRQAELGNLAYIYLLTGLVALLFLLFDGTIRNALLKDRIRMSGAASAEEHARQIRNKIYELNQDYNVKKSITPEFYHKELKRLQKSLRTVHKVY